MLFADSKLSNTPSKHVKLALHPLVSPMSLSALFGSPYYEKNCQNNRPGATTEPVDPSLIVSVIEEEALSFKGHCNSVLNRPFTKEYAPKSTGKSFTEVASRKKCSSPAVAQRTSAVPPSHTDAGNDSADDIVNSLISSHEPTVYTGRGLLPCNSFVFLAEAPSPRVGRQSRVDHRAIFAMNDRHAQMARYGAYNPDFCEADVSFARSNVAASVPDWAEFRAGTKNARGERKKKHVLTPRKSGGRVRGWVK